MVSRALVARLSAGQTNAMMRRRSVPLGSAMFVRAFSCAASHSIRMPSASARRQDARARVVRYPSGLARLACATRTNYFSSQAAWGALSSKDKFHMCADDMLDVLSAAFEHLIDTADDADHDEEFDIDVADGVLTAKLGDRGTWVINKQGPNEQLWWSSPMSGPKRYELDASGPDDYQWVNTRDGCDMLALLEEELIDVFGKDAARGIAANARTLL